MPDDKQKIDLDRLLLSPPEEVLAMFQNDLRFFVGSFESGLEILSDQELVSKHDWVIEDMKHKTEAVRDGLDLILAYLRERQAPSAPK